MISEFAQEYDHLSDCKKQFLSEIESVCRKHGIQISVSMYDAIEFRRLDEGDEPIHCNGIEDKTGE